MLRGCRISMAPNLEILAHVSAPSLLKHDKKHRAQAQGFLDFKPARRLEIASTQGPPQGVSAQNLDTHLQEDLNNISFETANSWQNEDFKPLSLSRKRKDSSRGLDGADDARGAQSQPSSGSTRHAAVQVTRTPHQRSTTAPVVPSTSFKVTSPRRSFSDSWEPPPSVVPDSQPDNVMYEHDILGDSSIEVPVLVAAPIASFFISPPAKRRRQRELTSTQADCDKQDQLNAQNSPMRSTTGHNPQLRVPIPITSRTPENVPSLPAEVIEPPPPRPALRSFSSHITGPLKALEDASSLTTKFRPKYAVRTPGVLDRGYWEFKLTSAWDAEKRAQFWGSLKKFIGEGRAGWGVRCERYVLAQDKSGDHIASEDDMDEEEPDDLIRVYCWGEVVRHIYWVLQIACGGKFKGTCAQWFDTEGEVVMQMA